MTKQTHKRSTFIMAAALGLLLLVAFPQKGAAQRLAVKANVLSLAALTPDVGIEVVTGERTSVALSVLGHYNPYGLKSKMLAVQPEFRFWLNGRPLTREYVGVCAFVTTYDMSLPSGKQEQPNIYKGDGIALGILPKGVMIDSLGIKQIVFDALVARLVGQTGQNVKLIKCTCTLSKLQVHLQTLFGQLVVQSCLFAARLLLVGIHGHPARLVFLVILGIDIELGVEQLAAIVEFLAESGGILALEAGEDYLRAFACLLGYGSLDRGLERIRRRLLLGSAGSHQDGCGAQYDSLEFHIPKLITIARI